jgi:hypothetical protein
MEDCSGIARRQTACGKVHVLALRLRAVTIARRFDVLAF